MRMFGEDRPTEKTRVIAAVEATSMETPVSVELPRGSLGYMTIKSRTRERQNQDMIFVMETPHGTWLVVADGMGSYQDTPQALRIFIKMLQKNLPESPDIAKVIIESQSRIIDEIHSEEGDIDENGHGAGGGFVFSAVRLESSNQTMRVHLYQLGDIRIIVAGHTPEDTALETEDQHEPGAPSIVTAHLSSHTTAEEVLDKLKSNPYQIEEGDLIIFCSDGVTGKLKSDKILEIIHTALEAGKNLGEAAEAVCREAQALGSQDDVTCLIYQHR